MTKQLREGSQELSVPLVPCGADQGMLWVLALPIDVIPVSTIPLGSQRLTQNLKISGLLTALAAIPRRLRKSLLLHVT